MVNPLRMAQNIYAQTFGNKSAVTPAVEITSVDDLDPYAAASPGFLTDFTGDKFFDGFGATKLFTADYWTLRQRSSQLFTENLYARGIIRRLITNEINTGLSPDLAPDGDILGISETRLTDWTEGTENRFSLWAKNPQLCDFYKLNTFGAIQRAARMEALIAGDVLVVLRQSPVFRLPSIQLISGANVQTPLGGASNLSNGHKITHGVETDAVGRVVAHWVQQADGSSKRLLARGPKSGRRLSWLVYGTDKRLDELRGQPLLSLVLQSLKEIDRYRDSAQRKAVVNSVLAMFIEKGENKAGTLPISGGAVRNDAQTVTDTDGATREFKTAKHLPGLILEELQHGEKPHLLGGQGTDINFGTFETAIIQAVAWANEIPPEILTLAFSNNYSASQAAINEFKIYLNKVWTDWGETFCTPIYIDWLVSETLLQKITAPGLLEAWRTPSQYDVFGAWVAVDWYGSIKPSTDMLKQVKGSERAIAKGLTTHAREARGLTGTKFTKNVKKLATENKLLAEAMRPMLELEKEFGPQNTAAAAVSALEDATIELVDTLGEVSEG